MDELNQRLLDTSAHAETYKKQSKKTQKVLERVEKENAALLRENGYMKKQMKFLELQIAKMKKDHIRNGTRSQTAVPPRNLNVSVCSVQTEF